MPAASSFTMRTAVLDDLDVLVTIDAQCFPPGIAYSRKEIAALLRAPASLTLIVERFEKIVGFAAARLLLSRRFPHLPPYAELITIDILPEFRRDYIGSHLYQGLEGWLIAQGAARVELHVAVNNAPAIRFYGRLGYSMMGRIPGYYLENLDAWKMEKILVDPPTSASSESDMRFRST